MRADERRHQQHGLGIGIHRIVGSRADVVHQPLGHSRIHGEEGHAVIGMANAFLHQAFGIGRKGQHGKRSLAVQIGTHNGAGEFFAHIFCQRFGIFDV